MHIHDYFFSKFLAVKLTWLKSIQKFKAFAFDYHIVIYPDIYSEFVTVRYV